MITNFEDKRASQLLARVGEDLSSLRHDMKTLVRHAAKHTLPDGARELALSGREGLAGGRDYASRQMRRLGATVREHPAGVSIGGVLLLAAVGLAAYLWINDGCCSSTAEEEDEEGY